MCQKFMCLVSLSTLSFSVGKRYWQKRSFGQRDLSERPLLSRYSIRERERRRRIWAMVRAKSLALMNFLEKKGHPVLNFSPLKIL